MVNINCMCKYLEEKSLIYYYYLTKCIKWRVWQPFWFLWWQYLYHNKQVRMAFNQQKCFVKKNRRCIYPTTAITNHLALYFTQQPQDQGQYLVAQSVRARDTHRTPSSPYWLGQYGCIKADLGGDAPDNKDIPGLPAWGKLHREVLRRYFNGNIWTRWNKLWLCVG